MFGEGFTLPKPNARRGTKPTPLGIRHPGPKPYSWPHMGRAVNTDYDKRMLFYKQQALATDIQYTESEKQRLKKDNVTIKYDVHAEKKRFQRQVQDRVNEKLRKYEEDLDRRREKLQALFAEEEREFIGETIDKAQKGGENRMAEIKARIAFLKAKREEERQELVKQKRMEQYMDRCLNLRDEIAKRNVEEVRNGQLQQMRENEARREAAKEEDKMWYETAMKEVQARMEREEQEAIDKYMRDMSIKDVRDMQIRAKQLLKEEEIRIAKEDHIEMQRVEDQMRKEQLEAYDGKMKKSQRLRQELEEQLQLKMQFVERRKKEEDELDNALVKLAAEELDKEKLKVMDVSKQLRKEIKQYESHLKDLEVQRKHEEKEFGALLEEHRMAIQRKQDAAQCKLQQAKEALLKNVLQGRAEQLKYKKQEAEEQLKLKEAENELTRLACATNERLAEEYERAKLEARKKYREDLLKQIEYNNLLRERERQELERQLANGIEEEERYRRMVEELTQQQIQAGVKHPFRQVLEKYDCKCPPPPKVTVRPPY